jgi:hypothetical protein
MVGLGKANVGLPSEDSLLVIGGRVDKLLLLRKSGVPGCDTAGVWGTEGGIAGFFDE